ncbi:MAG: lipopolysaccharide biosynthesis protein [Acidimicrobiales bacterium]|nr:lipopolysaccharide biosynthesis protein [Acidimicrobiales bacterium]
MTSIRSSVRWNAVSLGGRQGIRVATALLLAGMLGQANFGIMGMATVYVTFVVIFVQFGFGTALVQKEDLTTGDIGAATWLSLGSGALVSALTLGLAPLVADFFDTDELTSVLRVLAVLVLLKAFAIVPSSLLMREMRFAPLARAELAGAVAGSAAGITAAIVTDSYWAIVWQLIVMDAVTLIGILYVERRREWRTSRAEVRELSGFGAKLLGTNIVNFASGNGDNVVIGRVEGTVALADYSLSYRVLSLPLQVVGQTVARTILPTFSRLQHDRPAVADLYYRSQRAIAAMVTGPLVVVALASHDAIPWAFGDEWSSAVTATQWIAVAGILRLVFGNGGATMVAMGHPGWQFWWSLTTTAVSVAGFIVGVRWGIEGVAASIVIVGLPLGLLGVAIVGRLIPVSPIGVLVRLAPIAAAGASLLGLWWLVAQPSGDWPVVVRLVVRCAVTSAVYLGLVALIPAVRDDVLRLVRRADASPHAPSAESSTELS